MEFVERINIDLTGRHNGNQMGGIVNPYQVSMNDQHTAASLHANDMAADDDDEGDDEDTAETDGVTRKPNQNRKNGAKKRRTSQGRRRRIENENGQTRGRGSRYKRQVSLVNSNGSQVSNKFMNSNTKTGVDVYYIRFDETAKNISPNGELKYKMYKLRQKGHNLKDDKKSEHHSKIQHRHRGDSHDVENNTLQRQNDIDGVQQLGSQDDNHLTADNNGDRTGATVPPLEQTKEVDAYAQMNSNMSRNNALQRVKRKSGKTTGALSRPKGGGESSSKTTSRKDKGRWY